MGDKILISEIFGPVLQGEGHFAGTPSIFIRTFGCNFRCPAFGIEPPVKENTEVKSIIADIDKYTDLEDLPVVKTGCDTYYAIYPEFKKFTKWYTVDELKDKIESIINEARADLGPFGTYDVVFTGGEPLLPSWQKFYTNFLRDILENPIGVKTITFETNATQPLIKEFSDIVYDVGDVYFSMSVKLPNSGHTLEETIKPDVIKSYIDVSPFSWLKFVVSTEDEVKLIRDMEKKIKPCCDVFLMPCGGEKELFDKNQKEVYNYCIKYNYRFSPRLQVSVWNNGIGI